MEQSVAQPFCSMYRHVRRSIQLCVLGILLLVGSPAAAQQLTANGDDAELRKVQAALLYKFYFYVHGLPSQQADTSHPFRIGVLGEDPFGEYLDPVLELLARGHRVVVERSSELEDIRDCELVFISRSEEARLAEIMNALNGEPRVLVSDIEHFADSGGTIGFVLVEGSVGFEINQRAAQATDLKLSSRLLRLAERVLR